MDGSHRNCVIRLTQVMVSVLRSVFLKGPKERVTGNWPIAIEVSWQTMPFGSFGFIS